ncbi:WAS/WASL-interacting protein family member 2-like [Heliangelus exortis]|uniref:WAS/WASL-interacting protein family member 2-like n=1 Tax=Heliangelus exortis TaxID=472823 RepID=UPI003A956226
MLRTKGLRDTSSTDGGRGAAEPGVRRLPRFADPRRPQEEGPPPLAALSLCQLGSRRLLASPARRRHRRSRPERRGGESAAGACLSARRGPPVRHGRHVRARDRLPQAVSAVPPRAPGPPSRAVVGASPPPSSPPPSPRGGTRRPPGSPRGDTSPPDAASPRRGQSAPPRHRGTPSSCRRGQSTHRTRRAPFRGAGRSGLTHGSRVIDASGVAKFSRRAPCRAIGIARGRGRSRSPLSGGGGGGGAGGR